MLMVGFVWRSVRFGSSGVWGRPGETHSGGRERKPLCNTERGHNKMHG